MLSELEVVLDGLVQAEGEGRVAVGVVALAGDHGAGEEQAQEGGRGRGTAEERTKGLEDGLAVAGLGLLNWESEEERSREGGEPCMSVETSSSGGWSSSSGT